MSDHSAIEWTDSTWNPTTGCTKVSPACAHCYIERTPPFRIAGRKFVKGHIPLVMHENRVMQPLHWTKPRRVFVNSLSDLFHDDVPYPFIFQIYRTMARTPQHVYQVLTKRPERMAKVVNQIRGHFPDRLDHVWHGTSVENKRWTTRIDALRRTRSRVLFLSIEPLLGDVGTLDLSDIRWVIVGGESGPGFRAPHVDHVRSVRDQCVAAGVPFFFKQWGGIRPKSGGRELDGRTWDEFPVA